MTSSELIKKEAFRLGFNACGICKAEHVGKQADLLKEWLKKGHHGQMSYLENHLEKRCNPQLLVENAKSIIVVALNYFPSQKQDKEAIQFSYYAYGKDYHTVIKEKLRNLYNYIQNEIFPVNGRIFCDTAPILEKYHAMKAGLGWIGKHSQLIIPQKGSYFFLGEIIIDKELEYDVPTKNHCENCQKCVNACPVNAISSDGELDASRCLSYLTIEFRGNLPETLQIPGNQIYGCDICNKICPWNRFSEATLVDELQPKEEFLSLDKNTIENMDKDHFDQLFGDSAVKRAGIDQLKRNLRKI